MKRRVLAALLTATMLVGMFAACGGGGGTGDDSGGADSGSSAEAGGSDAGTGGDETPADDGASSGEKVKITMWWGGSDSKAEAWCDYIEESVEANCPNIDMEVTPIAWSEYPTKISVSLAGGTGPDILACGCLMLANFDTTEHNFMRLDDKLDGWDGWDDIYPNMIENGRVDGEFVGVLFPELRPYFWRKDLFEAAGLDPESPPQTLEEIYEYAEKLTVVNEDGITEQAGFQVATAGSCDQPLWAFMNIEGVDSIWDDEFNLRLNEPEVVKCVEIYNDIIQNKICGSIDSFDISGSFFVNGMAAMSLNDSCNNVINMKENMDWENVGYACPPGDLTGTYGSFIVINNATKHEAEAIEAWKVITSAEAMMKNAELVGYVPTRKSTEADYLAMDPDFNAVLLEMLPKARMYGVSNYDFVYLRDTCLNPTFSRMFVGELTPQECIDEIIRLYDEERTAN